MAYYIDINNYQKLELLGSGSFGDVYLVEDIKTHNQYAAKVSNKNSIQDKNVFSHELNTLINVKNPAILKIIGFSYKTFSNEPYPTIIVEYLPNGTLKAILEKCHNERPLKEWTNTKKYINLLGIAIGMKYLHSQDFIQRDLKPDNILLDSNYYPRICDFGFSKKIENFNSSFATNSFLGTPLYMAPEIWRGQSYNYKVDVYSYSLIAYEIITSKPILSEGENPMFLLSKIWEGKRPDTSFINDKNKVKFLKKCWSNNPKERPTFSEIVDILKDKKFYSNLNIDINEVNKYLELFPDESPIEIKKPKEVNKKEIDSKKKSELLNLYPDESPIEIKKPKEVNIEEIDSNNAYKITLVGDSDIKRSIFSHVKIELNDKVTISSNCTQTIMKTDAGNCITNFWDTCCDERFRSFLPMLLRDSKAVIIAIDVYHENEGDLQYWVDFVKDYLWDCLIYIAFEIHCDDQSLIEKIQQWSNNNGIECFLISPNDDNTFDSMFNKIAIDLINKYQKKIDDIITIDLHDRRSCIIF